MEFDYCVAKASEANIRKFLEQTAEAFMPPLYEDVYIKAYAKKIAQFAVTFEAWHKGNLVGLVAAYLNDTASNTGYITIVGIAPKYFLKGIADNLLENLFQYASSNGFFKIGLEVNKDNQTAFNFYKKKGFEIIGANKSKWVMERNKMN